MLLEYHFLHYLKNGESSGLIKPLYHRRHVVMEDESPLRFH